MERRESACGLRRRHHGRTATPLDHELNGITLFRVEAAQLVFHIDAGLAAQVEQVFALHVQFARQGINTDFLFLQMLLLCCLSRSRNRPAGP